MFIYETATACTHCGALGATWTAKITQNLLGNVRIRNGNEFAYPLRNPNTCTTCHRPIGENLHEHIRLIETYMIETAKDKSDSNIYDNIIEITNNFNDLIRKNSEKNKPDSNSKQLKGEKQHFRYQIFNSSGIECIHCNKMFTIPNGHGPTLICPHCAEDQKIISKNIITL